MAHAVRVATRGSPLAREQARRVAERLVAAEPDVTVDFVVVRTTGDRARDVPIHEIGGIGAFAKEIQDAVLGGRADVAVHSAKDLPAVTPPGLTLAAAPERGDARDALVGAVLDAVPTGGRVGTGSVRRRSQLAALRPDLRFDELRGNIGTRLERAAGFDAVVVAAVALDRLGEGARIAERLAPSRMLPQVGQGTIAVECRTDDIAMLGLLAAIDDPDVHVVLDAERAFLDALGGGCTLPCGGLATRSGDEITIDVLLASLDGTDVLRERVTGDDPDEVGSTAARRLLDERGGRRLLARGSGAGRA